MTTTSSTHGITQFGVTMDFNQALALIQTEYETRRCADHAYYVRTHLTLDGCNAFSIVLYHDESGYYQSGEIILTDTGNTHYTFFEAPAEDFKALCDKYGFSFVNNCICRPFTGMQDLYDFIDFLIVISDIYCPLDQM